MKKKAIANKNDNIASITGMNGSRLRILGRVKNMNATIMNMTPTARLYVRLSITSYELLS